MTHRNLDKRYSQSWSLCPVVVFSPCLILICFHKIVSILSTFLLLFRTCSSLIFSFLGDCLSAALNARMCLDQMPCGTACVSAGNVQQDQPPSLHSVCEAAAVSWLDLNPFFLHELQPIQLISCFFPSYRPVPGAAVCWWPRSRVYVVNWK